MGNSFFITGTGTGIGKTIVTCSLIRQLLEQGKSVAAIKPVITGWENDIANNDTLQIITSLNLPHTKKNIEKISPLRFEAPLAPSMAARKENTEIDYSKLVNFCKTAATKHEYLFCEGAGGVMVPITENKTTLDLMQDLGFSAILVAGTYLGTISHTLTAIKALEGAGIKIQAIIVNESEKGVSLNDTISELKNFLNYPIFELRRVMAGSGFVWQSTDNILECIS